MIHKFSITCSTLFALILLGPLLCIPIAGSSDLEAPNPATSIAGSNPALADQYNRTLTEPTAAANPGTANPASADQIAKEPSPATGRAQSPQDLADLTTNNRGN